MKMIILYILLPVLLFCNIGNASDSDGTDFVFSFINDWTTTSDSLTTSVIVIPSYNDSICTFKYTQISDSKVTTRTRTAYYNKTNEISFNFYETLLTINYPDNKFNNVAVNDFRIFAFCTEEVKLIGRISDPVNAQGDHFLIPSIKNAAKEYIFRIPTQFSHQKGAITFLPTIEGDFININFRGYINGTLFSEETIQYDTTTGEKQRYISISPTQTDNDRSILSVVISSSSPIMLSYASGKISTSDINDNSCGSSCFTNYGTFMPSPVVYHNCDIDLNTYDQRMITTDFTTRVYVSPPIVDSTCGPLDEYIYYDKDNRNPYYVHPNLLGSTSIELMTNEEMFTLTENGQMPMYRHGSVLYKPDSLTAYGHFLHYVPSTMEWVTGKTQFYTLAKDCYLEMYTDEDGMNVDFIKIDGSGVNNFDFDSNNMFYWDQKFRHFIISLPGYGLHTLENNGKYVLYVICKNVNGPHDAAGYLVGFNKWITP